MTQSDLQFRVAHTLRTYKRLHEDLRQAIFSGHHVTPEVSLHRPKNSAFGMWIDAAIAQHGEKDRDRPVSRTRVLSGHGHVDRRIGTPSCGTQTRGVTAR